MIFNKDTVVPKHRVVKADDVLLQTITYLTVHYEEEQVDIKLVSLLPMTQLNVH